MIGIAPTTSGLLQGLLKLYGPESLLYGPCNEPAAPAVGDGFPQLVHERVRQHNLGFHGSPIAINTLVSLSIWLVKVASDMVMVMVVLDEIASVNVRLGYPQIDIISPEEALYE